MAWVVPVVAAVAGLLSSASQADAQKSAADAEAGAAALKKGQPAPYSPTAGRLLDQEGAKPVGPLGPSIPSQLGGGESPRLADVMRTDIPSLGHDEPGGALPPPQGTTAPPPEATASTEQKPGTSTTDYAKLAIQLAQALQRPQTAGAGVLPQANGFNYQPTATRLADLYR